MVNPVDGDRHKVEMLRRIVVFDRAVVVDSLRQPPAPRAQDRDVIPGIRFRWRRDDARSVGRVEPIIRMIGVGPGRQRPAFKIAGVVIPMRRTIAKPLNEGVNLGKPALALRAHGMPPPSSFITAANAAAWNRSRAALPWISM